MSYEPQLLSGYAEIGPPETVFANSDYVAEITDGARKLNHDISDPSAVTKVKSLVIVFKRDGTQVGGFAPPDDFEPKNVGVFPDTGSVLAIGVKQGSKVSEVHLYSVDGKEIKGFRLWDNDPNAAEDLKVRQPWADLASSGAMEMAQLTSYGGDLLLVPRATSQPTLF